MYHGILNVYKEAGCTSHDVVARLRGICKQKKIGHTGTLDPDAVGVLPVCLGNATKLSDMLTDRQKEYVADFRLGVTTDTQDISGRILEEREVLVSPSQVREAVFSFLGDSLQVPPMYSALKVDGKKLYELARAGKEVERKPRPVRIYELEILEFRLPVVVFRAVCSKGTYIRTLCSDIGGKLGCGGAMQSLKRTRVGRFSLEAARTLGEIQLLKDEGRLDEVLLPVDSVFTECPIIHVSREFERLLNNGNAFLPEQTQEKALHDPEKWVRAYRADDSFAGIYAYDSGRGQYRPIKMFL